MTTEDVLFKFEVGARLFIKDTLSRCSGSVGRVEVLELVGTSGRPRYVVQPRLRFDSGKHDFTPRLVDEDDLSIEPEAYRVYPSNRARWGHKRGNET